MLALVMFAAVIGVLLLGFPVAFTLAGTALAFALLGVVTGTFDPTFLETMPSRIFGIMNNGTLVAVPMLVVRSTNHRKRSPRWGPKSHSTGYLTPLSEIVEFHVCGP